VSRDEREYATLSRQELRAELDRISKSLAAWHVALGSAKIEHSQVFLEAYSQSTGKSVTERRMEAEYAAGMEQRQIYEAQAQVDFCTTTRDMIVVLLERDA